MVESILVCWNCSEMTILPPQVLCSGEPPETGYVALTWPSVVTVSVLAERSTTLVWLRPMVKFTSLDWVP